MAMRHHTPGSCCCDQVPGPCDPYPIDFVDEFDADLTEWNNSPTSAWRANAGYLEQYKVDFFDIGRRDLARSIRWQQPLVSPRVSAIDMEANFTTGDAMGFRYSSHATKIGFNAGPEDNPSSSGIMFRVVHVYDEIEGNGFYTIFRLLGTSNLTLQSSTPYPGSQTLRILIERTPNTIPQSWTVTFFIDGVDVWSGQSTIPNLWDGAPCNVTCGYQMGGEIINFGTVRHPTNYVRFKSDYFAVGVTYDG